MNDYRKLQIPSRERLEVQKLDGTEEKNIVQVITSLASIKGSTITKSFRLYAVHDDGSLTLLEKNDSEPVFKQEVNVN